MLGLTYQQLSDARRRREKTFGNCRMNMPYYAK